MAIQTGKTRVSAILFLTGFFVSLPLYAQIDPDLATKYFREAEAISHKDGGRLWKLSLYGPMMFADPQTRMVIANIADKEGKLQPEKEIFGGALPESVGMANTATDWAGVHWTMVVWPLPQDEKARGSLMMHELFHGIQQQIGFPMSNPPCDHLNKPEGRIWMQMEWRALRKALLSSDEERNKGITDAILFRKYRRELFPESGDNERALEMNEGLAEYTGVHLSGEIPAALALLESAPDRESFVRSFAYVTGPAYGLLLDEALPDWRNTLNPSDALDVLLFNALQLQKLDLTSAENRAASYGLSAVRQKEKEREQNRRQIIASYRKKFQDDPRLVIPLREMQVQFDPNQLQPLEGVGTVYPQLRISDVWGVLNARDGALIHSSWSEVIVSAPTEIHETSIKGVGWTLDLNSGWHVVPDANGKDFRLAPI